MTTGSGPLGVFDSGVGGLTVVAALRRRFPSATFLYVADQAHVPYGERPLDEVRRFAAGISRMLAREGCAAIVMGCNISSAVALATVTEELATIPVIGTIAGVTRRAAAGAAPRIGVLATQGTVQSGAYTDQIRAWNPSAVVVEVPCPRYVPIVESGATDGAEALDASLEYLAPVAAARCTRVILGCTHYPYLLPVLRRAAAQVCCGDVQFLDPAEDMADAVSPRVSVAPLQTPPALGTLLTTGAVDVFAAQARQWLPNQDFRVDSARWYECGPDLVLRRERG